MIEKQEDKQTLLYIIWCAKEALYKLSEISLDFSENIFIEDFTLLGSGTFNAQIIHPKKTKSIFCIIKSQKNMCWYGWLERMYIKYIIQLLQNVIFF